jgi:carbamate kinase
MRPKIEAAIQFASRPEAKAVICNTASLAEALKGNAGTIVEYGPAPNAEHRSRS